MHHVRTIIANENHPTECYVCYACSLRVVSEHVDYRGWQLMDENVKLLANEHTRVLFLSTCLTHRFLSIPLVRELIDLLTIRPIMFYFHHLPDGLILFHFFDRDFLYLSDHNCFYLLTRRATMAGGLIVIGFLGSFSCLPFPLFSSNLRFIRVSLWLLRTSIRRQFAPYANNLTNLETWLDCGSFYLDQKYSSPGKRSCAYVRWKKISG